MTTLEIVIIAIVVVGAVLIIGGQAVLRRRQAADAGAFDVDLARANHDLAAAHAEDNGWDPERMDTVAREAFQAERPGAPVEVLSLVQVIDPPGTDDDKAVYEIQSGGKAHELTLGRHNGHWHFERLN